MNFSSIKKYALLASSITLFGCFGESTEPLEVHYSPQLSEALSDLHKPLIEADIPAVAFIDNTRQHIYCEFRNDKCIENMTFGFNYPFEELIGSKIIVSPNKIDVLVPDELQKVKLSLVYEAMNEMVTGLIEHKQQSVNRTGKWSDADLQALKDTLRANDVVKVIKESNTFSVDQKEKSWEVTCIKSVESCP